MKPEDKAKELSECFDERMGCYVVDDEKYEQFMQMHKCTEEYMLKQLEVWEDYYLNYKRFEVADALEEIINWFRSPEI